MRMLQLCLSGKASSDTGDQIREKDGSGGEKEKTAGGEEMSDLRNVSSNPHIRAKDTTSRIMLTVVIALLLPAFFGIYNFGFRALVLILISIATCVLTEYIYEKFGMPYTQDESYYLLDADEDEETYVYLGLKEGVDKKEMGRELRAAEKGEELFPAEKYVNKIPVKKHDHVLIPAGTVHCSGKNTMVLEISATPYIFTFKLWDWGRLGMDGLPRPIHLDHGMKNIQWNRDTKWVYDNIVGQQKTLEKTENCEVERTGLHSREFIDTIRYTLSGPHTISMDDTVHVMNLVEGRSARIESMDGSFAPFTVHYAETAIVPAAVGTYRIVPEEGEMIKMLVASVG